MFFIHALLAILKSDDGDIAAIKLEYQLKREYQEFDLKDRIVT